jgi:hypothetical protein
VIATLGLLVILVVPTLVWVAIRYWPKPGRRVEVQRPGPKHRWWQP